MIRNQSIQGTINVTFIAAPDTIVAAVQEPRWRPLDGATVMRLIQTRGRFIMTEARLYAFSSYTDTLIGDTATDRSAVSVVEHPELDQTTARLRSGYTGRGRGRSIAGAGSLSARPARRPRAAGVTRASFLVATAFFIVLCLCTAQPAARAEEQGSRGAAAASASSASTLGEATSGLEPLAEGVGGWQVAYLERGDDRIVLEQGSELVVLRQGAAVPGAGLRLSSIGSHGAVFINERPAEPGTSSVRWLIVKTDHQGKTTITRVMDSPIGHEPPLVESDEALARVVPGPDGARLELIDGGGEQ